MGPAVGLGKDATLLTVPSPPYSQTTVTGTEYGAKRGRMAVTENGTAVLVSLQDGTAVLVILQHGTAVLVSL